MDGYDSELCMVEGSDLSPAERFDLSQEDIEYWLSFANF